MLLLIDNSGGTVFDYAVKLGQGCGLVAVVSPKKHVLFQVDDSLEPNLRVSFR